MDRDVHGDGGRGQGARHRAPLGHGWRCVQVEIRRGRVAAAARPLCDVIFCAHHREAANGGGGGHGLSVNVVHTEACGVCRRGGAAPAPLLHISSVGHFRRNRDYLPKRENRPGSYIWL